MPRPIYQAVHPIGQSDPLDLPVRNIDTAGVWYEMRMEFRIADRDENHRSLRIVRDNVTLRLCENGRDPGQESCYIVVSDVEAARDELDQHEVDLSPIGEQEHDGASYRVFFARDPDGLCYCIGQKKA